MYERIIAQIGYNVKCFEKYVLLKLHTIINSSYVQVQCASAMPNLFNCYVLQIVTNKSLFYIWASVYFLSRQIIFPYLKKYFYSEKY